MTDTNPEPDPPNRGRGPVDLDDYPGQDERDQLLGLPNVRGHAIGYRERGGERTDDVVVRVVVEQKVPEADLPDDGIVPKTLDGVPTDVVEGKDELHQSTRKGSRGYEYQPIPGGTVLNGDDPDSSLGGTGSIGGMLVRTGEGVVGLTASHVLDDTFQNDAAGRPVYHPNGGREVGTVTHTEPFSSSDFCDTVYWEPDDDADVTGAIFGVGEITDVISPVLGMRVSYLGWRTGFTGGEIVSIDGTATFSAGDGSQVVHGIFEVNQGSAGGNSGSLVGWLAPNGEVLSTGMLVGGRETAGVRTTLVVSHDQMAQTAGLGSLEPITDGTPHPPVTEGGSYIEGHVRKIRHNAAAGNIEVDVYTVNTGGSAGSTVASIYEATNGYNAITSRELILPPLGASTETYTIDDSHLGDQLVFGTNDMITAFSADPALLANRDYLGFTATETYEPEWGYDLTVEPPTATATGSGDVPSVGSSTSASIVPPRANVAAHGRVPEVDTHVEPTTDPGPTFEYEEPISANPYGDAGYGEGGYGADYNPWVTERGWVLPIRGDDAAVYHEKVAAIFDRVDDVVARKGPEAERPPPDPMNPGRLYLVTDDDDGETNRVYVDQGWGWEPVDLDIAFDEDAVTDTANDEAITAMWQFVERIDASITGDAEGAVYAEEAAAAFDSESIGESPAEEFLRNSADSQSVDARWAFNERVHAENVRSRKMGGAITLPTYEESGSQ